MGEGLLASSQSRRSVVKWSLVVPAAVLIGSGLSVAGAADKITVTMVTDTNGLGDQNFNDLAHRGLEQAAKQYGIAPKVLESTDASAYEPNLTSGAEDSDLTIGVGFLLTDAMHDVAGQYPDKKFLLIDSTVPDENVASVTFKENEGAYLAGLIAGKMTKSNVIGIVGGQKIPPVIRYQVGFQAGIETVNPGAKVIISYADSFDDPGLGKELTLAQYNQKADIVYAIAGKTGIGCFDAVKQKGTGYWVVAADVDQSQLGAEYQLCVSFKGVDTAVLTVVKEVVDKQFKGGSQVLGLKEKGVGVEDPAKKVPEDVMALVGKYQQAIIAGKFNVPADENELKSFKAPEIGA